MTAFNFNIYDDYLEGYCDSIVTQTIDGTVPLITQNKKITFFPSVGIAVGLTGTVGIRREAEKFLKLLDEKYDINPLSFDMICLNLMLALHKCHIELQQKIGKDIDATLYVFGFSESKNKLCAYRLRYPLYVPELLSPEYYFNPPVETNKIYEIGSAIANHQPPILCNLHTLMIGLIGFQQSHYRSQINIGGDLHYWKMIRKNEKTQFEEFFIFNLSYPPPPPSN